VIGINLSHKIPQGRDKEEIDFYNNKQEKGKIFYTKTQFELIELKSTIEKIETIQEQKLY